MQLPLTLHQLEAFVEVAEQASFRRAADTLHVSQPALSRTVSQAESALRARLFDRDTRNVRLTAVGNELLPIARRVLREFESSLGEIGQFVSGRRGRVVIGTLPSAGNSFLPSAVAAFNASNPGVDLSIRVMSSVPMLQAITAGDLDFGICLQPMEGRSYRYEHLLEDPFRLVCALEHPLAVKEPSGWEAFGRYPY